MIVRGQSATNGKSSDVPFVDYLFIFKNAIQQEIREANLPQK